MFFRLVFLLTITFHPFFQPIWTGLAERTKHFGPMLLRLFWIQTSTWSPWRVERLSMRIRWVTSCHGIPKRRLGMQHVNGKSGKNWDPFFGGRSNYTNVIISHFWRDDDRVPVMGEVIFVGVLFILPLISVEERFGRLNWMRKAVKTCNKNLWLKNKRDFFSLKGTYLSIYQC